jgi:hypothetical protein
MHSGNIVIRRSGPGDGQALAALAHLDDQLWHPGPALVAEVDGTIRAALPLDGRRGFADPFFHTAELSALLEVRAAQLARPAPRKRPYGRVLALAR